MSRLRRASLVPLVLACAIPSTLASGVARWSAATAEEFAAGTLDGTAIDAEGGVVLAPPLRTLWGPEAGIVWAVRGDRDSAFVALSAPGRLVHVAQGKATVWLETAEDGLVTALTPDGAGGAWVGLSPDGQIVHARGIGLVDPPLSSGAAFVWALDRAPDGTLWAGTGVPGRLLRLRGESEPETVFESGDDPVRCVLALEESVLLGTGGRGRLVRVDRQGRAFVLLDADEDEIVAVAAAEDGTLWVLAAAGSKEIGAGAEAAAQAAAAPGVGEALRVVASAPEPSGPTPARTSSPPASAAPRFAVRPGGSLYRVDPDGAVRRVWQTEREMPFALVLGAAGLPVVGTGDQGSVWLLDRDGRASRLLRIPSDQASALARTAEGSVLVGGTTDARLELLGAGPRSSASYFGPAIDAGTSADWGRVVWQSEGRGGVGLRVRAGNTAEPDATWTDWSPLAGDGEAAVPAGLGPSRWLQLRVDLSSSGESSPRLRRLAVSYLPRNRPPHVERLQIEPPGVAWTLQPMPTGSNSGPRVADDPVARRAAEAIDTRMMRQPVRKNYEVGARTFSWEAKDPDGDRLRYDLEMRREGDEVWLPLARDIADEFFSWDARGTPDGAYRVRLIASDRPDNGTGRDLADERQSDVFVLDNTRPELSEPDVRARDGQREFVFTARDRGGRIVSAETALDAESWRPLAPQDGVADSDAERFRIEVDPSVRALRVRVTDEAGNVGGAIWPLAEDSSD